MSNRRAPFASIQATELDLTNPRRMLGHDTANALCANAYEYDPSVANNHRDYYDRLREVLNGYHDASLRRISVPLTTGTHNLELLKLLCYDTLTEETINDWYVMVEKNMVRNAVARYASGLITYRNLVPQHEGNYPAERLAQVAAIVRATEYLWNRGKTMTTDAPRRNMKLMTYIEEDLLRDQIDTNDDPIALAEFIISRDLTTGKEVADFVTTMNQLQTPLKEGAL